MARPKEQYWVNRDLWVWGGKIFSTESPQACAEHSLSNKAKWGGEVKSQDNAVNNREVKSSIKKPQPQKLELVLAHQICRHVL